jgi:hypothetical protein
LLCVLGVVLQTILDVYIYILPYNTMFVWISSIISNSNFICRNRDGCSILYLNEKVYCHLFLFLGDLWVVYWYGQNPISGGGATRSPVTGRNPVWNRKYVIKKHFPVLFQTTTFEISVITWFSNTWCYRTFSRTFFPVLFQTTTFEISVKKYLDKDENCDWKKLKYLGTEEVEVFRQRRRGI